MYVHVLSFLLLPIVLWWSHWPLATTAIRKQLPLISSRRLQNLGWWIEEVSFPDPNSLKEQKGGAGKQAGMEVNPTLTEALTSALQRFTVSISNKCIIGVLTKNHSEVHLHTRHSVHILTSLFTKPSFRGSGSKTRGEGQVVITTPSYTWTVFTWKEHMSVSSTLIMAPALSNSPQ